MSEDVSNLADIDMVAFGIHIALLRHPIWEDSGGQSSTIPNPLPDPGAQNDAASPHITGARVPGTWD